MAIVARGSGFRKRLSTAAAAAITAAGLVAMLAGCSLIPPAPNAPILPPGISPSPQPTSLLSENCPVLPPEDVQAVRIPKGTPQESISSVLNSYGAWMNAGTGLLRTWGSAGRPATVFCVDALAAQYRQAYSDSIFTTHSDRAWQQYYAGQEKLNAQSLHNTRRAGEGPVYRGHFELLKEIDSSATANGTFLKFDAIYRPGPEGAPVDPDGWGDLEKPTRWYVELIPVEDFLVINFIEQTPANGY